MKVSVITPCFNHGKYLDELVDSFVNGVGTIDAELIIINDGSTDLYTLNKFIELEEKGYNIIHQENRGLSAARNTGIKMAKGEYILPLDADNKVAKDFIPKCVNILDSNVDFDIVYSDCICFNDDESKYKKVGEFNPLRLINMNFIDACAFYRKSIWEKCGGYDEEMRIGHEDWELWLRMFFCGSKFYYLREPGFYYRVLGTSMNETITGPRANENIEYIYAKHSKEIVKHYRALYSKYEYYSWLFNEYIPKNRIKSSIKSLFNLWKKIEGR